MFTDSVLDSNWPNYSRRGWSTLVSFAVQTGIMGSVLLLPLIYTSGLPPFTLGASLPVTAPSPAPFRAAHVRGGNSSGTNQHAVALMVAPHTIPRTIEPGNEVAVPAAPDFRGVGISGGGDDLASGNGVDHGFDLGLDVVVPPPAPPVVRPPRVSRIMEGNLIYRVQPDYPSLAKLARIQGAVKLRAVISKQGTIENLEAVGGPPMLMKAAIDAVQQWRYRPYLLNGEPVEVDTEVIVNFVLWPG